MAKFCEPVYRSGGEICLADRDSGPSLAGSHMRYIITASFRATVTFALRRPTRLAKRVRPRFKSAPFADAGQEYTSRPKEVAA